ncbi:hypothetical protein LIER_08778 [Lithospermum erythrorhizon]|uniref:Uncharacterized protein n=1 Tax=Lithospermum erythrorhizon TaxID=34254 RepID=A0AAV3PEJ6_LITER
MSRKRKSHSPVEDELPDEFFKLVEPESWWREEGTIYNFSKDYDFLLRTWFVAYTIFLEPLRGPVFWTKSPYPAILPPNMRVLPGRPKRCRNKDAAERAEEAEKQVELKAKKKQDDEVFKASRKGVVMHCKICGGVGHNTRTNPRKPAPSDGESGSQPAPSSKAKKRKIRASSSQPAPSTREDGDL